MKLISTLQREVIETFCKTEGSKNFYLTGGTALSLFYLKHRRSNDLDFFTAYEDIILPFSIKFEKELKENRLSIERVKKLSSFIELFVQRPIGKKEETVVHIGLDTPFRFEDIKEAPEFPGLKIDSLTDIATNKVLALFGRASLRDFIDVYFLIKKKRVSAEELIKKAKIKDPGFDLYWFCVALERIHRFNETSPDMLLLLKKIDFSELLTFFENWRKGLSQNIKE